MSQVWAFWAPPCSSTSSAGASPHTSALSRLPDGASTQTPLDGRRLEGQTDLGGVLVEHPELVVVGHPVHPMTPRQIVSARWVGRGRRRSLSGCGDRAWPG